ncbi:MAG: thiamine-phosphate kinase [Oligoflexales bacterium]
MKEFELIDAIKSLFADIKGDYVGIGDDCAVLPSTSRTGFLVTTDALVEGVHFPTSPSDYAALGHKALGVSLSDIAAMGGEAKYFLLTLSLPQTIQSADIGSLLEGMKRLAKTYNVALIGGDTTSSKAGLVITTTVLGVPHPKGPVLRSGAREADWIFVTGRLGGSLPSGRHLTFTPRLHETRYLLDNYSINSMIDISDGLASDLGHILKASDIGAVLDPAKIPIADDVRSAHDAQSALRHALCDGEDFEVCFTVSEKIGTMLLAAGNVLGTPLTYVGRCCKNKGLFFDRGDGRHEKIDWRGYEHKV